MKNILNFIAWMLVFSAVSVGTFLLLIIQDFTKKEIDGVGVGLVTRENYFQVVNFASSVMLGCAFIALVIAVVVIMIDRKGGFKKND